MIAQNLRELAREAPRGMRWLLAGCCRWASPLPSWLCCLHWLAACKQIRARVSFAGSLLASLLLALLACCCCWLVGTAGAALIWTLANHKYCAKSCANLRGNLTCNCASWQNLVVLSRVSSLTHLGGSFCSSNSQQQPPQVPHASADKLARQKIFLRETSSNLRENMSRRH
jgi:hypothetical protein